jgi:hypothetical protein
LSAFEATEETLAPSIKETTALLSGQTINLEQSQPARGLGCEIRA